MVANICRFQAQKIWRDALSPNGNVFYLCFPMEWFFNAPEQLADFVGQKGIHSWAITKQCMVFLAKLKTSKSHWMTSFSNVPAWYLAGPPTRTGSPSWGCGGRNWTSSSSSGSGWLTSLTTSRTTSRCASLEMVLSRVLFLFIFFPVVMSSSGPGWPDIPGTKNHQNYPQ